MVLAWNGMRWGVDPIGLVSQLLLACPRRFIDTQARKGAMKDVQIGVDDRPHDIPLALLQAHDPCPSNRVSGASSPVLHRHGWMAMHYGRMHASGEGVIAPVRRSTVSVC